LLGFNVVLLLLHWYVLLLCNEHHISAESTETACFLTIASSLEADIAGTIKETEDSVRKPATEILQVEFHVTCQEIFTLSFYLRSTKCRS
jgi:hypothetical protein